jgi:hypothetical protein
MKSITLPVVFALLINTGFLMAATPEQLCNRTALSYAHIADLGDPVDFAELFTTDGVLTTPNGSLRGKAQIAAAVTNPDRPAMTTRHVITNHRVVEKDGSLTGTAYYTLYMVAEGSETVYSISDQPIGMGVYRDTYVIENGKCKFKERVAERSFTRKKDT